jgi:RND family efflux transporter MFP subunit
VTDQLSSDLASLRIRRNEGPPRRSRLGTVVVVLVLGGLLVVGGVWAYPRVRGEIFKTEVSATEITMVSPVQASVTVTTTGYVVPQVVSKVGAKVPGRVAKVHVKEGDVVTAGDPLMELEAADQKSAIGASGSRVDVARARAEAARASLAEIKQQLDREKTLVDRGVVGKANLDDLVARARSLEAQVKAADAEAKALGAETNTLRVGLQDRLVVAPISGTVVNKPPELGEIVGPQSPAVFEIVDFTTLVVETDVPETRLSMIQPGSPCEIVLDAYPSKRYRGATLEIGKRVNRAKATVPIKVKFVDAMENVLPEMSARTSFLTEALSAEAMKEPPRKVIAATAVAERDGKKVVFVIDDGTVKSTPVTVGPPFASGLELVDGPAAGTKVVSNPAPDLRAGQRVKEKE